MSNKNVVVNLSAIWFVIISLTFKRLIVETMLSESLSLRQTSTRFNDISTAVILQWKRLYERELR